MCGIVGYSGADNAIDKLVGGLRLLEYRGYDSAGVAVCGADGMRVERRADYRDSVANLEKFVAATPIEGGCGIGHTRWATHGAVSVTNTHPLTDVDNRLAVAHNGIIENYQELRDELEKSGLRPRTETDTEMFLLLTQFYLRDGADLEDAFAAAARRLQGSSALLLMDQERPGVILGARIGHAGELIVAHDDSGATAASDLVALAGRYAEAARLGDRELFRISPDGVVYGDLDGAHYAKSYEPLPTDKLQIDKGAHAHFFIKEILEQPQVAVSAVRRRIDFERGRVEILSAQSQKRLLDGVERVVFVGMGSSFNVGMLAAMQLEFWTRLPATAELSSEFRYREPALDASALVVLITQSGETADTLAALDLAKRRGARTLAVVENSFSQASRLADETLVINAGNEVSVAATKTVTASMLTLTQFAIQFARRRQTLDADAERGLARQIAKMSEFIGRAVDLNADIDRVAAALANYKSMLYIGRFLQYPVSREGALKMKETAYIHAEGVAASEMKHGANSLITPDMPIVAIAAAGGVYDKIVGNINVARARGGKIVVVAHEDDYKIRQIANHVLPIPRVDAALAPIVALIPLQLLAYHTTIKLGNNPDRPRNLAKTVTVE